MNWQAACKRTRQGSSSRRKELCIILTQMAPRNKRMSPNHVERTAATEDALEEANAATEQNETNTANEAWAAAEGYTPLADLRGDGAVFMAFDPNDNQEETFTGTFFADVGAFGTDANGNDDDEWNNEHEDDTASEQDNEFRSVADQALQALDEEYSMALSGVVLPPTTEIDATLIKEDQKPKSVSIMPPSSNESNTTLNSFPQNSSQKEVPPIDTDAVRKAVDNIKLKAPRLTSDLNKWEEQHGVPNTSILALAPREHVIIPKTPLAAFWRQSTKAIAATANLSRSATCAQAIHELELLQSHSERLVIHIVGADHVECSSVKRLQTLFGPLVRWIGALQNSPHHVELLLVGPNVPSDADKRPSVNVMPANKISSSRLTSATATCHEAVYHEWLEQRQRQGKPDLIMAFNSGIWGYKEWIPTLEALCNLPYSIPFVSTSYTIQECEDDAEVIETVTQGSGRCCLWKAQANPFASRQIRETHTAVSGREYRENAAWQAWRLGGGATN